MKVTLVGPWTNSEGKRFVKGQEVDMSEEDARWYKDAVLAQRSAALSQPMVQAVASVARPSAPADASAHPDVSTSVNSTDRTDWQPDSIRNTIEQGAAAGTNAGQDNSDEATDAQKATVATVNELADEEKASETVSYNTRSTS